MAGNAAGGWPLEPFWPDQRREQIDNKEQYDDGGDVNHF